ncbi:Alpha-L-arabinofuranosidase 1 [Spatholobus suberectus]|nr:Alpha-L-arabinofuranosidase 1 [Spatholobus suberectus]
MGSSRASRSVSLLQLFIVVCLVFQCFAIKRSIMLELGDCGLSLRATELIFIFSKLLNDKTGTRRGSALDYSNWTKVETVLVAKATNQWLDQVSAMPLDTYKGHGFCSELVEMLADLKPKFIRFPGNYLKFFSAIRSAYPDIQIISNCDGSSRPLDHPADMYDYHAFVSEYAVTGKDAGTGSVLAALADAGFLIGQEKNRFTETSYEVFIKYFIQGQA